MDADAFRRSIARWRDEADLNQFELDEECDFLPGTVGRLERETLALTDENLAKILICTNRDLLSTFLEEFGSLYRRLRPLDAALREDLGKAAPPQPPDQDEEFERGSASILSGLEIVLRKLVRAGDHRTLLSDALLEFGARNPQGKKPRQRVRKKGGTRKKTRKPSGRS